MSRDAGGRLLKALPEHASLIRAQLERCAGAQIRDVPDVVVEALELEQQAADHERAARRRHLRERLDGLRVRDGM